MILSRLAIALSLSLFVSGVERSKFKTCEQASFCARHRAINGDKGKDRFQIDADSITSTEEQFSATILDSDNPELGLELQISFFTESVARLKFLEKNPVKTRFEVPDVLLEQPVAKFSTQRENDRIVLQETGTPNTVVLHLKNFLVEFKIGDDVVLVANERNLLSYEYMRERPESVPAPIPDEQGVVNMQELEKYKKFQELDDMFKEEKFSNFPDSKPNGNTAIAMDFSFQTDHVYGIPEHADSFALKDTTSTDPYRLYNLDVFEYELNNPMALYGHIPFMHAHNEKFSVGLLWLNAAETWVDIASKPKGWLGGGDTGKDTHWISESGIIDVFVMFGSSPQAVSKQYSKVTGTTYMPPKWSLGYHQCRWNYNDEDDVDSVHTGFDTHDIPMDVIWLDIEHTDDKRYFTWHPKHFQTPEVMQNKIKEKQRKMIVIIDPHIKRDNNFPVHKEASDNGYYVKDKNGNDYNGHCWPGASSWPDFLREDVRNWWMDKLSFDSYKGSTDILHAWNDMNEPSVFNGPETTMHKDVKFGDIEHRDAHNIYGMFQHRATAEGLVRRSGGKERPFVLSRAFFASSQRYGAIWTGDNAADWGHLKISAPMLLSINIAGLPFAGADVGGFFGNVEPELFVRWYQSGIFYPFFRAHAHLDSKRREPWLLEPKYMDLVRSAIRMRYKLLSYLYTLFYLSHNDGSPLMRALWYHYPEDKDTFAIDDTYLYGDTLLVSPVTEEGQQSQSIYFPGNEFWYQIVTFDAIKGPGRVSVPTPLDYIPAYQRAGTILPMQMRPRRASAMMEHDPYTLVVALDSKGLASGVLYLDDGHSYDFKEKNSYGVVTFNATDNVLSSTVTHEGTYTTDSRIERVILLGVSTTPKTIRLNSKDLIYNFNYDKNMVTIKDPAVNVLSSWSLSWE